MFRSASVGRAPRPGRARRRKGFEIRIRWQSFIAALALFAVSVTGGAGIDRGAAAEPTGVLEYAGDLPDPFPGPAVGISVAGVDNELRHMYAGHTSVLTRRLVTYDLRPAIPTVIATRPLPKGYSFFDFASGIAPARKMFYSLAYGPTPVDPALSAVGIEGNPDERLWLVEEKLPGFIPWGLTYSAVDDRIYTVGEMAGTPLMGNWVVGRKPTGIVTTVAAFDPDDGSLIWARPLPECGQVIYSSPVGSLIARSAALPTPTLLIACGTGGALGGGDTSPGQAGALELRIDPTAGMAQAAAFDVRFHPISGSYFDGGTSGFAKYDPGSDRLFLQSLSITTPGAWVFDARLGGWAGFISAPSRWPDGQPARSNYGGVHPTTGHYYMGGGGGNPPAPGAGLVVADGRASPPQAGVFAEKRFAPYMLIGADPGSNRIFIPTGLGKPTVIARDLTKSVDPLERPDYDGQTDDVDEAPGTFVSFTGDTGGFGARVTAVGDTSAATGPVPLASTTPVVGAATRGLIFARVPTASVQPAGAAAAAQAASSDTVTGQAVDQNRVTWPYEPRTCLDGGEGAETPPAESVGGRAEVRCDLAHYESTGSARQAGVNTGPVSIGDARVDTRVKRTAKDGMSTVTTSSTSGIRVEVPGAGSLTIGRVETVARTSAHGRSGTASAEWTRKIADVSVRSASGEELFATAGCSETVKHDGETETASGDGGACDALADAVRRLLQVRVRLLFPRPAVEATPKGAFARVGQTDIDAAREVTVNDQGKVYPNDATTRRSVPGLQIDVYNDSTERSRYVVQLAGAENSSIYTVNKRADDAPCDMGGCIPGGFDEPSPRDSGDPASSSGGSLETATASLDDAAPVSDIAMPPAVGGSGRRPSSSAGRSGLEGLILAQRSLGDGGLMASFLVLVAAAVGAVARRRRLHSVLAA